MKLLLAAVLAIAGCGPVIAADLKLKAAPAPYVGEDPWNGFYLGINGGYGIDRGGGKACCTVQGLAVDLKTAPQGFIGGLQAGYMHHVPGSGFVLGIEADGDIATLDGSTNNPGFIGNANSRNRWLASLRGRAGYLLAPNALAYITGGWGWGSNEFGVNAVNADGSVQTIDLKATKSGAVLGGGLEVALSSNWFARAEYLHYFLNDMNMTMPSGAFLNVNDNVSVARGGLNYKF
jgi:opacity protein-like surface antigen